MPRYIQYILKVPNKMDYLLFSVASPKKEFDPSLIDDLFSKYVKKNRNIDLESLSELIDKHNASIIGYDVFWEKSVLLASLDLEQSILINIFWMGRKSTLALFGISGFKHLN